LRFLGASPIRATANSESERKIVGCNRLLGYGDIAARNGNFGGAFKRQLGLVLVGRSPTAARAIGRKALGNFTTPGASAVGS